MLLHPKIAARTDYPSRSTENKAAESCGSTENRAGLRFKKHSFSFI